MFIALILMILGRIGFIAQILIGYDEVNGSLRNLLRLSDLLFWGSMVYLFIQNEKYNDKHK
ncbi:hypothetical protein [Pradoshia sp.]